MSTPPFHVLVIDDEPDLRELYELSLLRAGYVVDTAASVTAAKELLSKKTFAAVITDMRLSDGLGIEVLQTLQALGRTVPVRAVFGTAGCFETRHFGLHFSDRRCHHMAQLRQIDGFAQIVKSARFECLDRVFSRAIGGDDDGALFASQGL